MLNRQFIQWLKDDGATAAIEAGILFPLLVLIMCGTIDIGVGVLTNQKIINATQIISDLATRTTSVAPSDLSDAIIAGQLALAPYSTTSYGVDIVGIQFLNLALTPTVIWRRTQNMLPNATITANAAGLGAQDEGVIAVTVQYTYHPFFTQLLNANFPMTEISYARGRKGGFVTCTTGGSTC